MNTQDIIGKLKVLAQCSGEGRKTVIAEAVQLIERQQSEIERLNNALKGAAKISNISGEEMKNLKSENASLREAFEFYAKFTRALGKVMNDESRT